MYVYLIINGYDIMATQQDVENMIIDIAAGNMNKYRTRTVVKR